VSFERWERRRGTITLLYPNFRVLPHRYPIKILGGQTILGTPIFNLTLLAFPDFSRTRGTYPDTNFHLLNKYIFPTYLCTLCIHVLKYLTMSKFKTIGGRTRIDLFLPPSTPITLIAACNYPITYLTLFNNPDTNLILLAYPIKPILLCPYPD